MSLTIAMRNALTGLSLNQMGMSLTSNNISNVNTPGYSRKIIEQMSRTYGGVGSGVDIAAITRRVSDFMVKDIRTYVSKLGGFGIQQQYFNRLQDSYGQPGSANAINTNIGRLGASFEALGTDPQSSQAQLNTVDDAVRMARQINEMATSIQNLRAQADADIVTTINQINALAQRIDTINTQIAAARNNAASGQTTADLEDQRDQAIRDLSELVDVQTYPRSDGRTAVVIAGGYNLVDQTYATVGYSAAPSVTPSTTFNPITFNGIGNISSQITSGKLKALIDLRDTSLQNSMAQLDALALQIRNRVNAAHNQGTTFPAPNSLTGNLTGLAAATAVAGTGIVRVAVTDASGNVVSAVNVDLATTANMTAVLAAINAGLGANGTASINGSGQLVITATNAAHGVSINENTSSIGGSGFSSYFGLNDFFVGTDNAGLAGDLALSLAVRSDIVANPSKVARAKLSLTATAGQAGITPGDATVAQQLAAVFTSNFSFSATGGLPAMTTTIGDFSAAIIAYGANLAARAKSDNEQTKQTVDNLDFRLSSEAGVDINTEMANMVTFQNAFSASAKVMQAVNEMFQELESILR